jgi:hypothetical protein
MKAAVMRRVDGAADLPLPTCAAQGPVAAMAGACQHPSRWGEEKRGENRGRCVVLVAYVASELTG